MECRPEPGWQERRPSAHILAARATRSGHALGADFSRIQVAEARRLAAAAGVANARCEVADAQVHPFGAGIFDVVLSSLGVMFFDDRAAAGALMVWPGLQPAAQQLVESIVAGELNGQVSAES